MDQGLLLGPSQPDTCSPTTILSDYDRENILKELLRVRDDIVGRNQESIFLQSKKVETYLKFLLSKMEADVLNFITREAKNHTNKTERWFLRRFTNKCLITYKRRIYNF